MRRVGLFVLVSVLASLGACSRTKTLDTQGLQGLLATKIEQQLGVSGATVACPDDVNVEAGGTFECTATSAGGKTMTLEVTQTDDRGNVTFKVTGAG